MSNSNSSDSFTFSPKIEIDTERVTRLTWTPEMTKKLIETLELECEVIWNAKHPLHKDRVARLAKMLFLAELFKTTSEEINRKIHNLRTQFNNELRKLKKKQEAGLDATSGWEYFEALLFLRSAPSLYDSLMMSTLDPLDTSIDSVNIELAEFQAEEEKQFGFRRPGSPEASTSGPGRKKPTLRVAASAPMPLPSRVMPNMWPEQPRIQPIQNADECQIFGDFVASELRALPSESRRKLKRIIQRAILKVGEVDEDSIYDEEVDTIRRSAWLPSSGFKI